jgi:dihydrofolate reductase
LGRDGPGQPSDRRRLEHEAQYLASTTIADPQCANTTLLSGDLAAAIGEMKAELAGDLQVHGSGALTRWLLANDLVDEMTLIRRPQYAR